MNAQGAAHSEVQEARVEEHGREEAPQLSLLEDAGVDFGPPEREPAP